MVRYKEKKLKDYYASLKRKEQDIIKREVIVKEKTLDVESRLNAVREKEEELRELER